MKNKLERVLFITEKWCDGEPGKGLTNSFHNLFGTFSNAFPNTQIGVLHLDEVFVLSGVHIDTQIPGAIDDFKPDLVVVSHLGNSRMNPTSVSYYYIRAKNIPICFTWPDTRDWVIDAIKYLSQYSSLDVSFGGELEKPLNEKHINLWAPQDPTLYYPGRKFIPVSFLGSLQGNYSYRIEYINYLIQHNCPIIVSGGQREAALSAQEYARLSRSSQCIINFPESAKPGFNQIKGRVFEAMACKSLLFEKKNDITSNYFQPNFHYAEYENEKDLVNQIEFYCSEDGKFAREKIAERGNKHYNENYSSKIFWDKVIERIF